MANFNCFLWKASISSVILFLLYQSSLLHRKVLLICAWKHLQLYNNTTRIKYLLVFSHGICGKDFSSLDILILIRMGFLGVRFEVGRRITPAI